MPDLNAKFAASEWMATLSRLLLLKNDDVSQQLREDIERPLRGLDRSQFDGLCALANSNHVLMRGFEAAAKSLSASGDETRHGWFADAMAEEKGRIGNALTFLRAIFDAFDAAGYDLTAIKSLDHWPDIGTDLDLYTDTPPEAVIQLMKAGFGAQLAQRSWGDRLACKWNFELKGLPDPVEIHMGRLGQTGEQNRLAGRIARHARTIHVDGFEFRTAGISDRIMISTLQRMYRHFYFRLCDIVDTATVCDANAVDFDDLCASATVCGIWEGVATYLVIVSDYVHQYRGVGLSLPMFVRNAARFGGQEIRFGNGFLRVPILPQSAGLYGTQLSGLFRKGDFQSGARLSLLPWLATAAAVGQKITGSDKGIW